MGWSSIGRDYVPRHSRRQPCGRASQVLFIIAGDDGCMQPFDELSAAIDAERSAWLAVKDHLPGTEGHDPRLWDAWLRAMRRCQEARAAAWSQPHPGDESRPRTAPRDDTLPPASQRWQ
jgi:hypothetical protein